MSIPLYVQKGIPAKWQRDEGEWLESSIEWTKSFRLLMQICKRIGDGDFQRECDHLANNIEDGLETLSTRVWERYEEYTLQNLMTHRQIRKELEQCATDAEAEIKEAEGGN